MSSIELRTKYTTITDCFLNKNYKKKLKPIRFKNFDNKDVKKKIRVMTYNIWGVENIKIIKLEKRLPYIVKEILHYKPDIVCIQEMSRTALEYFKSNNKLINHYYFSEENPDLRPNGEIRATITTFVLSRFKPKITKYLMETNMFGYPLIIVEYNNFLFANIHLQSGGESSFNLDDDVDVNSFMECRKKQLLYIKYILKKHNYQNKNTFVMGDFNFDLDREPEKYTLKKLHLQDTWKILMGNKNGFTENTDINKLRWNIKQKTKLVRYDAILYRGNISPIKMKIIGNKPIFYIDKNDKDFNDYIIKKNLDKNKIKLENNKLPYFPSDHFGIITEFEIMN